MIKAIQILSFFIYSGYYAGLAITITLGYINISRYYSIPIRIMQICLMLFLIYKAKYIKKNNYIFIIIIFFIFYIIKILYSYNLTYDLSRHWSEYIFYFLSMCILPFFSFGYINLNKYYKIIINSILFSGFIISILSIYLYKDVLIMGLGRISLIKNITDEDTLNPLALSYSGAFTITLSIYKLFFEKVNKYNKLYIYLNIILAFIIFYLGASRGSLIVLILSILIILYYTKYKIRLIIIILILIPIIKIGADITGSEVFSRATNTIESSTVGDREFLWKKAINEFLENPILGGRIEVTGSYPHNIFLEILMSMGAFGFIMFLYLFINALYKVFILSNKDKKYVFVFIFFINGFSQYMFSGSLYGAIMLFIPMGILLLNYDHLDEKNTHNNRQIRTL